MIKRVRADVHEEGALTLHSETRSDDSVFVGARGYGLCELSEYGLQVFGYIGRDLGLPLDAHGQVVVAKESHGVYIRRHFFGD